MLEEMGFGIDVLVHDPRAVVAGPMGSPPRLLERFRGLQSQAFGNLPELERCLREGEFRAVFSDIFYDWRLTQAGKAQFSQRNFEMGLKGALRSLQNLLHICRLPFYERYAPILAGIPGRAALG
jgi:hypothetical protein